MYCIYEKMKIVFGDNVFVGYNVLVYGCIVEDNVLIGMGVIVMDNCYIEVNCIIVVGVVLLEGICVESWLVYVGIFVKKVKDFFLELFCGEV